VDEGQWVEGKLSGLCNMIFRDGPTLEGEFREGRQWNARGVLKHPDGTVEECEWAAGKVTGQCKRTFREAVWSRERFATAV
jgi:hypothetical protein